MAVDASGSQSRTKYLRICTAVWQCALAVTGLNADSEFGLMLRATN